MPMKHNCCNECEFEWISIDPAGKEPDKLKCKICGRTFEEIKLIDVGVLMN